MLRNIFNNRSLRFAVAMCAAMAAGACSLVREDLPECPAGLKLRFVFDCNLLEADAFPSQVKSVYVWAFDEQGTFVWSGNASGTPLTIPGFVMDTPLLEGKYDFVAWCGLKDNADFTLATYTPARKEELEVKLNTYSRELSNISSSHFSGLFHGYVSGVEYVVNPLKPYEKTVTIPLMKDTNDIVVMLNNNNGTPINKNDFTVTFTYADSWLAWDNSIMAASPVITYTPWNTLYGETTIHDGQETVLSTLIFEMSTSRLMADDVVYLDIVRNSDHERIVHLPLIECFILEKGSRYDQYTPQQYLDRRDDYSVLLFLDDDRDWYSAGGVYINGWVIVPPQPGKV